MGQRGRRSRNRRRRNSSSENSANVSHTCVELMEWFRAHRGGFRTQGPPLRLSVFPDTGRGLMTLKPIARQEVLISIPVRFLITRKTAENSLRSIAKSSSDLSELTTHHLIAVFLLRELDKDDRSFWYPYLKTLPGSYSVPFFCDPLQLDSMPNYVKEKCLKQQKIVTSAFKKVRSVLDLELGISRFTWAWFTVNTRAVYFDNKIIESRGSDNNLALAPFLDMFNHSADVAVSVGVAESPNFPEGVYQIISSNRSYKKFDQVFINYGPHDNLKLCLEYGFVLDDNTNDFVPISVEEFVKAVFKKPTSDKRIAKALEFLQAQGLDKSLGIAPGHEPFTWSTLSSLYVLNNFSCSEHWSTIYSMDSEAILGDSRIRDNLETILTSRLAEADAFMNVSSLFAEGSSTAAASLTVVRQLVKLHRDHLNDGLESLKRRLKAKG